MTNSEICKKVYEKANGRYVLITNMSDCPLELLEKFVSNYMTVTGGVSYVNMTNIDGFDSLYIPCELSNTDDWVTFISKYIASFLSQLVPDFKTVSDIDNDIVVSEYEDTKLIIVYVGKNYPSMNTGKTKPIPISAPKPTTVRRDYLLEDAAAISRLSELQVAQNLLSIIERLQDMVNQCNHKDQLDGYCDDDLADINELYRDMGLDMRFEHSTYTYSLYEAKGDDIVLLIPADSPRGATMCFGKHGLPLPVGYWDMNSLQKMNELDDMYRDMIENSIDNMYGEEDI